MSIENYYNSQFEGCKLSDADMMNEIKKTLKRVLIVQNKGVKDRLLLNHNINKYMLSSIKTNINSGITWY